MNHFSPVMAKQSPVTTPGKNLTGDPRTVRDTIADINDVINKKWNAFHLEGITVLTKMQNFLPRDLESEEDDLNNLCFDLFKLVEKCSDVVKEIEVYNERLKALATLHDEEDILFSTLPIKGIVKQSKLINEAYRKELEIKKLVCENIAHVKSVDEAVYFGSLWKYQVEVDTNVKLALEILLEETGLGSIF